MGGMASLTDFLDSSATDASVNAGEDARRAVIGYQRDLRGEVNRDAARGSFFSGGARTRADTIREDAGFKYGDIQRQLSSTLADLTYKRILAATGFGV